MQPWNIGPYRVIARLGSGGMGEVFRAYDERLKRWVAIKQIQIDDDVDPQRQDRFRREAQAAARLNHPSIVQIYDIVEATGSELIVMELVEGRTLATLLRDGGSLSLEHGLPLARQIAAGLAEAHSRGIVHRDLKTENVMVTAVGLAKILDFGLAKRLPTTEDSTSENISSLSAEGWIVGTSRAMSPEQAQGLAINFRSDLFSFGTLLYETFTGVSPFRGTNQLDTWHRVCSHRQPPVTTLREELPVQLAELIDHLLHKEPSRRPASASEVAGALDRLLVRYRIPHDPITDSVLVRVPASGGLAAGVPGVRIEPTPPARPAPNTGRHLTDTVLAPTEAVVAAAQGGSESEATTRPERPAPPGCGAAGRPRPGWRSTVFGLARRLRKVLAGPVDG